MRRFFLPMMLSGPWLSLACGEADQAPAPASLAEHGLPVDVPVSALSDAQRLALCIDARSRTFRFQGTELEECTAAARAHGRRDDVRGCEASIRACLDRPAWAKRGRDMTAEDHARACAHRTDRWEDDCHADVATYDACVDAIAQFHQEHVALFSCDPETGNPRVEVFDDLPACVALRHESAGSCGVFVPTSLLDYAAAR